MIPTLLTIDQSKNTSLMIPIGEKEWRTLPFHWRNEKQNHNTGTIIGKAKSDTDIKLKQFDEPQVSCSSSYPPCEAATN